MPIPGLRSPFERVGGLVFFGRALDKIRLEAAGQLPPGYNLGDREPTWFDGRLVRFLRISYPDLRAQVLTGASDEQVLTWCFAQGRRPSDEEILIWNTFMQKRGWKDEASAGLQRYKEAAGLGARADLETIFAFLDADEGRATTS